MSYNKYKGLLLQNDFEHDEDDFPESHTASTVTLISQQHQQRQFNKRLSMAKPNNQTRITQVKPYEKSIQLQQQQEQQLQPYNIPGIINNIPSHRRHYNNINENNFTAVRRIRKPSLWLGNVEKAKQQQQKQQVLRNKSRNNDAMTFDNDTLMMNVANNDVAGDLTQHRMLCKGGLVSKVKAFIIEFLQDSSIHGFVYLAKIGLSLIESRRTWQRFQTSPMVISMDRNKLVWNTSFPSLTVCPHKRIDELKVEEYIM
ncbi:hypothetical protein FF38_09874 [Lucilia cuprina]|uniref:Uncharacterized protein n=1 Tax=Lucilia cuprina TaxID=7375 RepID=A0A0L0CPR3_LUCCU|nr:hypothetical protein FF38_09874 [Lucilia cuprina]